jgi:PAS domain-containing protein/HPt (histidine-containing phosphotransfer) domain-containing protein
LVLLANSGVIEKNFITTWSQLIGANLEMVLLSFALGARINLIKSQKLRAEREMLRQTEEKRKLQAELIETQEENIRTLDAKVKERTRDIREILTNINQGIFTLQKDMAIGEEFSDHLTTMLDDRNLAQRPLREAFLDRTNLSQDEVSRIITSLEFSIGEDADFGWNANKDSLTREFRLGTDDKSLIVEADWSPIVNQDGEVEKVLVALRDVTELRALRARAAAKEQEATMLLEMLSNDLEKTQKFLERSLQNWYKIDEVLVTYLNDTETNYNALYRLYHTLKGNARSLNFAGIASAIHDLETQLKDVYENYTPEKLEVLRKQSNETHSLIRNYHTIFLAKFARFMNDGSQKKAELFETFFENNVLSTVERVAKDLGRPIPVVEIDNPHGLQVTSDEIEEILQNILNHLVRNSLDHGIEPAEERRNAGKTPYGHIQISIAIDESKKATIKFYDDGRGLNMSRIYQLGVEKGLLSEGANEEELVEVVFRPGFSTAKSTSMISGRGVGMDAVRHYALSLQASFNLVLDQPLTEELMEKIRSAGDDDVYITFRFESEVSLSTRQTPSSVDQAS